MVKLNPVRENAHKARDGIVVIAGLTDHKLHSKLAPLLAMEGVGRLTLVRRRPLNVAGVNNVCPPSWMAPFLPLAELYRLLALLWLCLGRSRPDLLVGIYMVPHGIYAGWVGRLTGTAVVQLLIGNDLERSLARGSLKSLLHRAWRVGVRGDRARDRLLRSGIAPEKIFMPPNVFDVDAWTPSEKVRVDYDMIYVGSLVTRKQPEMLLDVVAALRPEFPAIKLAYVGSGPLSQTLQGRVNSRGLQQNVVFLGEIPTSQVAHHLSRSRLFTMAYKAEGLPMSLVEAISCGVPPVITDADDVAMVAEHGRNAWIIAPGTVQQFSDAVRLLLTDRRLYGFLREGAIRTRQKFRQAYSLDAAVQAWSEVIQQPVAIEDATPCAE